jgi:hypothetical protein
MPQEVLGGVPATSVRCELRFLWFDVSPSLSGCARTHAARGPAGAGHSRLTSRCWPQRRFQGELRFICLIRWAPNLLRVSYASHAGHFSLTSAGDQQPERDPAQDSDGRIIVGVYLERWFAMECLLGASINQTHTSTPSVLKKPTFRTVTRSLKYNFNLLLL